MPKAEVGSAKHLSNQMRRKGLQRLRWYCQVCEKQCFDDNGFKMHTQSESHVRQMLVVGEDSKKFINDYSRQFQRDFLQLLRTSHGEKAVQINQFYQSYIANKEHVHMNATKWPSLTEFAKHLGREGICRVEDREDGKGIHVAWIDDSPEAMRRREAVKRKEMQDKGDEEREQRMIKEQIKRANKEAAARGGGGEAAAAAADETAEGRVLKRDEGEKIKLSFGAKPAAAPAPAPAETTAKQPSPEKSSSSSSSSGSPAEVSTTPAGTEPAGPETEKKQKSAPEVPAPAATTATAPPVSLKMTAKPQPKNVFAAAKKNNALSGGGSKKPSPFQQPKKMSEAERIMKEEMEKNNKKRSGSGFGGFAFNKKQRTD